MIHYLAFINIPGYLPEGDTLVFDTPGEAWAWLADERKEAEEAMYEPGDDEDYSETVGALIERANAAEGSELYGPGTVLGDTPGCTAQQSIYDLGRVYGVGPISESDAAEILALQD
jgi:hypothetical protein